MRKQQKTTNNENARLMKDRKAEHTGEMGQLHADLDGVLNWREKNILLHVIGSLTKFEYG